jgi:hypothetical protein
MSAWSVRSGAAARSQGTAVSGGAQEGVSDRAATDDPPTVDSLIAWMPEKRLLCAVAARRSDEETGAI